MSHLTQAAIYGILQTDGFLQSALARHPTYPSMKAIFNAFRNENPDVYPQLVFFEKDARPDPDPALSGMIFHEEWEFQVWDNSKSGIVPKQIIDRLMVRFHEAKFVIPGARLKYCHQVKSVPEAYDKERNQSFYTVVFHLAYQRLPSP